MRKLLSGNEAIAQGAYEAGVTVGVGYPGTPSTEILENFAKYEGVYAEWAPNEKVALEVGIGASLAKARTLVTMKHVGVNVAADPLFTLSYTGVEGGLVLISADDPSLYSSQNEQDNRHYARAAKIPMLEPTDSQQAKDLVRYGYELSECYDTPVMVRVTTRISHAKGIVELGEREELDRDIVFEKNIPKYVMVPAHAAKRHVVVEQRMVELEKLSNEFNQIEYGDRSLGIITSGVASHYAREVFPDASYLVLGMSYPLPKALIREFAENVDQIYVIEELDPFIEEQVKAMGISVRGKDALPMCGELNPHKIRVGLTDEDVPEAVPTALPARPPVLCPGCPHRGVFYVLRKLRLNVTGDIGCYTLSTLPPLSALHTCICMGASIGVAHGIDVAGGQPGKTVAVIGDSTFMHSGVTGLINVVYNRGNSTVIIVDNRTTAMTGGQEHPGTGVTLQGKETVEVDFLKLAEAIGVEHVHEVDPHDLEKVERIVREEVKREAPSLIVAKRPCVLLDKKHRKPAKHIDTDLCADCKLCLRLGCPGLAPADGHMEINELLCAGCELCTQVCNLDAVQ